MKAHALHAQLTVYTVGHSTRSLDDFVVLLRAYGIERLVDVRTIPRSRHNPQFNNDTLGTLLRNRHIGYHHMKELGGLRHARADSANTGWHNASFRGFADYMQTPEFDIAVMKLVELASEKTTAIMCAEAVPWRCHRSLIGDALIARGVDVVDIYTPKSAKPHVITPMAEVHGTRVTYPAPAEGGSPHSAHDGGTCDSPTAKRPRGRKTILLNARQNVGSHIILLVMDVRTGIGVWRRTTMMVWTFLMTVLLMSTTVFGAGTNDVFGQWKTDGGDSRLEFFRCGEKVCGKIVWLKEPNYIDSKDGPVGKTKVDRKNPNPALRNRPILGLQVMKGLTAKGGKLWGNGACYDPETGKSYKCKMHLVSPNRLELRGYIGVSLFGRNFALTR